MTDWMRKATSEAFDAPDFRFDSSERLDLRLHCRTLGDRGAKGGAVLMLHGTTGGGAQFLQPGMADALFGEGRPLDASRHFIVLPDAIGHGKSSKPSDGLGPRFPHYGYGDIVRAQHLLVTQHLGLAHLRLVLGASMGGMQTWMWGQSYPDQMDALMPVASLPERVTGRNLLWRRLMLEMIRTDPGYRHGKTVEGLGLAWNIFKLIVDSPARLAEQLPDAGAADALVRKTAADAVAGEDPNDVIWEFEASKDYDPAPGLGLIMAPLLAVNFQDDDVNPAALGALERAIGKVPNGRAVTLPAGPHSHGHQTMSTSELWSDLVRDLLTSAPFRQGRTNGATP